MGKALLHVINLILTTKEERADEIYSLVCRNPHPRLIELGIQQDDGSSVHQYEIPT